MGTSVGVGGLVAKGSSVGFGVRVGLGVLVAVEVMVAVISGCAGLFGAAAFGWQALTSRAINARQKRLYKILSSISYSFTSKISFELSSTDKLLEILVIEGLQVLNL